MLTGWKTFILGAATILLGILQSTAVTNLVEQYPGPLTMGIGLAIIVLRLVTNAPAAVSLVANDKVPVMSPTMVSQYVSPNAGTSTSTTTTKTSQPYPGQPSLPISD